MSKLPFKITYDFRQHHEASPPLPDGDDRQADSLEGHPLRKRSDRIALVAAVIAAIPGAIAIVEEIARLLS